VMMIDLRELIVGGSVQSVCACICLAVAQLAEILLFSKATYKCTVADIECESVAYTATVRGATTFSKLGGPIPWSRLLYITKYGWYTQFRALQSAAA